MKRRKKRKKPKADDSFSNMRIHIPYLLETKGMGFFVEHHGRALMQCSQLPKIYSFEEINSNMISLWNKKVRRNDEAVILRNFSTVRGKNKIKTFLGVVHEYILVLHKVLLLFLCRRIT